MEHCGLHSYFSGFYGSELERQNTPKAELIASVLKDWRLSASETAMIGDRHHDIEGAVANGVYSVGVTYGYGSPEELTEAGADALCSHPTELTNQFLC
jgi:phosphoglycolate phosphatase